MARRAGLSELGELLHSFDEVIAKVPEARERALKAAIQPVEAELYKQIVARLPGQDILLQAGPGGRLPLPPQGDQGVIGDSGRRESSPGPGARTLSGAAVPAFFVNLHNGLPSADGETHLFLSYHKSLYLQSPVLKIIRLSLLSESTPVVPSAPPQAVSCRRTMRFGAEIPRSAKRPSAWSGRSFFFSIAPPSRR